MPHVLCVHTIVPHVLCVIMQYTLILNTTSCFYVAHKKNSSLEPPPPPSSPPHPPLPHGCDKVSNPKILQNQRVGSLPRVASQLIRSTRLSVRADRAFRFAFLSARTFSAWHITTRLCNPSADPPIEPAFTFNLVWTHSGLALLHWVRNAAQAGSLRLRATSRVAGNILLPCSFQGNELEDL